MGRIGRAAWPWFCAVMVALAGRAAAAGDGCPAAKLAAYEVVLHTFWSRESFPKHYPDWRPAAQFSKLIGRSHDKRYSLFRLGQKSSEGVKTFAETGKSDILDGQGQLDGGVYDEFTAPSIAAGVGRTETRFFVDGNHSKVSLMSRIVPSPDWFIGIDGFDLCVNGNWLDSITVEVDPIDAGTDNGFTFTAPNWPTDPQGEAYRITAHYPAHPAGSFFYPNLKRLPPIATFQFIKLREYELSEEFTHEEDDRRYEVLKMDRSDGANAIDVFNGNNNDIQTAIEEEREEREPHDKSTSKRPTPAAPRSTAAYRNFYYTTDDRMTNMINQRFNESTATPMASVLPKGNKNAIMHSIADSYLSHKDRKRKKYDKLKKTYQKKSRAGRDCRVSSWSQWSPCSKSCGIGEMQRRREVTRRARRGGRLCPPLVETKWCGSARSCNKQYFNW
ncbi:unnamed protein product [Phyllotreta striolata]|uniref:Spondin domain-containing protein n=1 Tax=Phyllotreta striolata TaxID=444603 RepID=A0A9N9TP32_PHYSR|nr:unnamed protein product [Phyllotreta striolata]